MTQPNTIATSYATANVCADARADRRPITRPDVCTNSCTDVASYFSANRISERNANTCADGVSHTSSNSGAISGPNIRVPPNSITNLAFSIMHDQNLH